jgi:predicted dehydrogenase
MTPLTSCAALTNLNCHEFNMAHPVTFMTLDPAHFHAALVHKEMHPGISPKVHIYAPVGPDLLAHLDRLTSFNTRANNPTNWQLDVHAGPDFLERMLRERPGDVVMLSGRNRKKIDYMLACAEAGLHVLADKPWIIHHEDFPKLERLAELTLKRRNKAIIYDMMTERYEITNILQRELIRDCDVFGEFSQEGCDYVVQMKSIHAIKKTVAGQVLRRPTWFFDVWEQGEGLADVGTHLVDLVNWILFPDKIIDLRTAVDLHLAEHSPTLVNRDDFRAITGEADFPSPLQRYVRDGILEYWCNNGLSYLVNGFRVGLEVRWTVDRLPSGADVHEAVVRGTRASVQIRQDGRTGNRPEVYIVPIGSKSDTQRALSQWVNVLSTKYPDLLLSDLGSEFRIDIPDDLRIGHEAHFAQVTDEFIKRVRMPSRIPAWEMPNLLAKYYITTKGVALARTGASS